MHGEEFAKTGRCAETLEITLKRCKEEGILTSFLHEHEHEVKTMYAPLYDQDTITRNYINDVAATQRAEGRNDVYLEMLRNGQSIEQIMNIVNVSREHLEELKKEVIK